MALETEVIQEVYQVVASYDGSPLEGSLFKGTFDECKSYIRGSLRTGHHGDYDLDILSPTGRLTSYVL